MDPGAPNTSANTPGTPRPTAAVPLRLLLADDNDVNQEAGKRILERRGHSVVLAGTGKQVLELLAASAYDIVLMDVQMPEMDGLQATAAIREQEKATGKHQLIVAMTAHAMAGDRERLMAAGMDGYVSKPINRQELFDTVERLAGKTAPAATVAPAAPAATAPAPAATGPIIDRAELMENLADDLDLLRQLATTFHATTPKLMDDLRAALAQNNGENVKQWAHKMAGKFGVFFAHAGVTTARELEAIGKSGNLAAAPPVMACLESQFASVSAALKELAGGQ